MVLREETRPLNEVRKNKMVFFFQLILYHTLENKEPTKSGAKMISVGKDLADGPIFNHQTDR